MSKRKVILVGTLIGIYLIGILSWTYYNPSTEHNGSQEQQEISLGNQIANRISTLESKITYIWSYNNTWIQNNLSSRFGFSVQCLVVGQTNNTIKLSLWKSNGTVARFIDKLGFEDIMANFKQTVINLDERDQNNTDIDDIWPPDAIFDFALDDNTALSILYSKDKSSLCVINGTWEYAGFAYHGIDYLYFSYNELLFLRLVNHQSIQNQLQNLEDLLYNAFN